MNQQTTENVKKLIKLGAHLKDSWIDFINSQNFQSFDDLLLEFLYTDIEETTEPDPFLLTELQNPQYRIQKPIIVQVDEIIDVSLSDRDRLHNARSHNPTLKLLVNNSGHRIGGVIQDHMEKLSLDTEPGIKVIIKPGAFLVYGVIIFTEEDIIVLGGNSPQLIDKKNSLIESAKLKLSIFSNLVENIDELPKIQFGLNAKYVFHDLNSKRYSKKSNDVLQSPFQVKQQPESKQETIIQPPKPTIPENFLNKEPKPSIPKPPKVSASNTSNMPVFKPTRQMKNLNTPAPSLQIEKPSYPHESNKKSIIELWHLYNIPTKNKENILLINAYIKRLRVNNSSLSEEEKKMAPFIVTLESPINRQQIGISIDPLFLELLFNLDYINKLSPEDLIATSHLCEKKIKEILKPPLSIIDKGSGRPSSRFLLTNL